MLSGHVSPILNRSAREHCANVVSIPSACPHATMGICRGLTTENDPLYTQLGVACANVLDGECMSRIFQDLPPHTSPGRY